eukprot:TRINITY_DN29672_c0_g1_i1.p1 TRINITY_DN29672_c0_g1~~TRINITY_DN29672_c0_g1_i1.p1  ORF type:complete len:435 (+),score=52.88 TRINITY_DN29672_c0_g1_i1:85-1305(+)
MALSVGFPLRAPGRDVCYSRSAIIHSHDFRHSSGHASNRSIPFSRPFQRHHSAITHSLGSVKPLNTHSSTQVFRLSFNSLGYVTPLLRGLGACSCKDLPGRPSDTINRSENLPRILSNTQVALHSRRRSLLVFLGAAQVFFTMSAAGGVTPSAAASSSSPAPASAEPMSISKVFVAGSTGNTGKRIVEQLVKRGFKVRAGVRDLEKGREALLTSPSAKDSIELVQVDVTDGLAKLKAAIGDADAVMVATGFRPSWDLTQAWKVDNLGTVDLVQASLAQGVQKFVLISSILTNGAAWGQLLNPSYLILNVFGGVLIAKLQAEKYIQRSGINYTIVRPGGLKNEPPSGVIKMSAQDTLAGGSISRDTVAEVATGALLYPEANYKTVEIITIPDEPARSFKEMFASIPS